MATYSLTLRQLAGPSGSVTKSAKLTATEGDGNLIYLYNLASTPVKFITNGDSGSTLDPLYTYVFANISTSINITLPDVVIGKKITFIRTDGGGETHLQINGPFVQSETQYNLYGYEYNTVTFVSDGILWYKIATT